jgi:hypothetical protein
VRVVVDQGAAPEYLTAGGVDEVEVAGGEPADARDDVVVADG